jgi:hypothetical protein
MENEFQQNERQTLTQPASDVFYVIKVINNNTGVRGYVIDKPKGIMLVTGGVVSDLTQFKEPGDAQMFIRQRKIERSGIRAYVRSNQDLMKEAKENNMPGISALQQTSFFLENDKGEKLCFDAGKDAYHFDKVDVGYCLWKTEDALKLFIAEMKLPGELKIKPLEPKR